MCLHLRVYGTVWFGLPSFGSEDREVGPDFGPDFRLPLGRFSFGHVALEAALVLLQLGALIFLPIFLFPDLIVDPFEVACMYVCVCVCVRACVRACL